jgi:hypothetical protein
MNRDQRLYLAEGLRELANLAAGALLLGQFLAKEFNWIWTIVGLLLFVVCYWIGYMLLRGGES